MSNGLQTRKPYLTDLTDDQWAIVEPLIPGAKNRYGGRPRTTCMREVVNTTLYLNRTGCQWDMLPHDLLPKSSAYDYFALWRDDGTLTAIVVTGANADDGSAAPELLETVPPDKFSRLRTIFGDNKYHNKKLNQWLKKERPTWSVEVNMRPKGSASFLRH